jgi:hypothetical protein
MDLATVAEARGGGKSRMDAPMYHQVAEDLRKQIDSGTLERGSQLPTELELRERYNASSNTIRDAIKRLISQGLVETRPGQGTFVAQKIDPFVTVLTADPPSGFGGSYLRGELSGSLALLDRITRKTTVIACDGLDEGPWEQGIRTGSSYSYELSHQALRYIEYRSFAKPFFRTEGVELIIDDDVFSAFFARQRCATRLRILDSEERAKLQAAALTRMLAIILIVVTAIWFAVCSIFRFAAAATIIVRTLMAHRNSREPAYSPTSCLPRYQSLAGVALAQ